MYVYGFVLTFASLNSISTQNFFSSESFSSFTILIILKVGQYSMVECKKLISFCYKTMLLNVKKYLPLSAEHIDTAGQDLVSVTRQLDILLFLHHFPRVWVDISSSVSKQSLEQLFHELQVPEFV